MRTIDLTGRRFGRLVVLAQSTSDVSGTRWHVACDCGKGGIASACNLKSGHTQSCGCLHKLVVSAANTKHGRRGGLYLTWKSMLNRCFNRKADAYVNYGGRGITVCATWLHDYSAFVADMGPKPTPTHTLDRRDNDGPYSPDNCRWATRSEQNANRRQRRQVVA